MISHLKRFSSLPSTLAVSSPVTLFPAERFHQTRVFLPAPSLTPPPPPLPPQLTYLPPPWGECEAKALGFFHVYSVTACRIDCETRYIVENCNCRMVHMPGREAAVVRAGRRSVPRVHAAVSVAGDASYCTPEQYKDCAEPALGRSARAPQHT